MSFKCILGFHTWNGCKCTECGKIRDEQHDWIGLYCSKCGKHNSKLQIQLNEQLLALDYKSTIEEIKNLLLSGADVNAKNKEGETPLLISLLHGYDNIAKFLIENHADVNVMSNTRTPLLFAIEHDNQEMVKLLLSKGANINVVNEKGENILFRKMYILTGVMMAIQKRDFDRYTTFEGAKSRFEETLKNIKLIVNYGIDLNIKNTNGDTPLFLAEHLLGKIRDEINSRKNDEPASFILSTIKEYFSIIKIFVEHGADIDEKDDGGYTILLSVAINLLMVFDENKLELQKVRTLIDLYLELMDFLVNHGANIDISPKDGMPLLMYSINDGNFEFFQFLINHGAEVNIGNGTNIPLLLAIVKQRVEFVKLLLEKGADINRNNINALDFAMKKGNLEIIELIQSKIN